MARELQNMDTSGQFQRFQKVDIDISSMTSLDQNMKMMDPMQESVDFDSIVEPVNEVTSEIDELKRQRDVIEQLGEGFQGEIDAIDEVLNGCNENGAVDQYNRAKQHAQFGYGPTMQASQMELSRYQKELDEYVKEHSDYSSYQELLETKEALEKKKGEVQSYLDYYDRLIQMTYYYGLSDQEDFKNRTYEGMLGEREFIDERTGRVYRGSEYELFLSIANIGEYDELLKNAFGDQYKEMFSGYGLDLDFDYLKMYNYLYETQGPKAALDYFHFMEDTLNSISGLKQALENIKRLETDNISDYISNYLFVHAQGLLDGCSGNIEGALAWFSTNTVKSPQAYQSMWYAMMLQTEKYGKLQTLNYQVGSAVGNTFPTMLLAMCCPQSLVIAEGVPLIGGAKAAKVVSSSYMLLSSGGKVYQQQLTAGKTRMEAIYSGLLYGLTNSLTQRFLGGLPFLSNTLVYNFQTLLLSMGKEGMQEVLQDFIMDFLLGDGIPTFQSQEEEEAYWDQWLKEKIMTFFVGALTAGETQMPNLFIANANGRYIQKQIDEGLVTEEELVLMIRKISPEETRGMSDKQIMQMFNQQIVNYLKVNQERLQFRKYLYDSMGKEDGYSVHQSDIAFKIIEAGRSYNMFSGEDYDQHLIEELSQEIAIVKRRFPGISDEQAYHLLDIVDSYGICAYAAAVNMFLQQIYEIPELRDRMSDPDDFNQIFGYKILDENGEVNPYLLLLDFYAFVNRTNYYVTDEGTIDYTISIKEEDEVPLQSQEVSFIASELQKYINVNLLDHNSDYMIHVKEGTVLSYTNEDTIDLSQLSQMMENGESISLGIADYRYSEFKMYEYDPESGKIDSVNMLYWDDTEGAPHAMTVTKVTDDGVYVLNDLHVYFIPVESFEHCGQYQFRGLTMEVVTDTSAMDKEVQELSGGYYHTYEETIEENHQMRRESKKNKS